MSANNNNQRLLLHAEFQMITTNLMMNWHTLSREMRSSMISRIITLNLRQLPADKKSEECAQGPTAY